MSTQKQTTIIGYKTVLENMKSKNGQDTKWVVGKWKKHKGELSLCNSGYHASEQPRDVIRTYRYGPRLFIVEARGERESTDDKFVAREMRLVKELPLKKISVEWAVACARRVLSIYEKKYPGDKRAREAIVAAERWMKNPNKKNARAAAAAAAAAAAYAACAAAADAYAADAAAAAYAAYAARAAADAYAADAAAAYAACAAADAYAADAAAYAAELDWQNKKLQTIIKKHAKKTFKYK